MLAEKTDSPSVANNNNVACKKKLRFLGELLFPLGRLPSLQNLQNLRREEKKMKRKLEKVKKAVFHMVRNIFALGTISRTFGKNSPTI